MSTDVYQLDVVRKDQISLFRTGLFRQWRNEKTNEVFQGSYKDQAELDEWDQSLKNQGFTMTDRLAPYELSVLVANRFRAVILEWLGPETCRKVDEDNKTIGPLCCATHDHCDANMAMDQAMQDVGVYQDLEDGFTDAVTALWNEAWSLATQDGFAPKQ